LGFSAGKWESGDLVAGGIELASLLPMLAKKSLKALAIDFPEASPTAATPES